LGLGLTKKYLELGYNVIATERKQSATSKLAQLKEQAGNKLRIEYADINHPEEIKALRKNLDGNALDILFVNAGVSGVGKQNVGEITNAEFLHVMLTNSLSPMRSIEAFEDLVKKEGTIAVMSSAMGSIEANNQGGMELYRTSKAALNMFMKNYSLRSAKGKTLLAVMPGWVRTDMGGENATLDVETSVEGMVKTLAAHEGKGGLKFVDYQNQNIPW
jgi:NAD(P)-dependent dehydrogenase (short-subunit alcohol dehydrogenase family)